MSRWLFTALIVVFYFISSYSITPISSIGSDPYLSTNLSPQDLLLRKGNYLFYDFDYQNSPFWGDIDEPGNKPNTNTDYTVTGDELMNNGGTFSHSGSVNSFYNGMGYAHLFSNDLMATIQFKGDLNALRDHANGNFTGNTYPDGATMPFDYSLKHTLSAVSIHGALASKFRNFPVGISIDAGRKNTLNLDKSFSFSKYAKNGDSYTDSLVSHSMNGSNARAFFGWTIPGCNHILGERGTQGDSWFQNEYATGPLYHFNCTGGITLPKMKAGSSFELIYGHQNQYYWKAFDTLVAGDTILSNNFYGRYHQDNMARLNRMVAGRVFGNRIWKSGKQYSLNTFGSIRYADSSTGSANADNLDAESGSIDHKRSITLECSPNINVMLGDFFNFIDIAGIFVYTYSRYSNIREAWVGGGTVKTFQNSSPRDGWGDQWEHFSYANENTFDIGADLVTMFPLFVENRHHVSLNLRLLGDVRFTFQSKYYGESAAENNTMVFTLNNIRENYNREVMFNTAFMLQYLSGPMKFRFIFTKPVLYSQLPRTIVTDEDGNKLAGYPLENSPQLISQKGISIGIYAYYDFTMPFLSNNRKLP